MVVDDEFRQALEQCAAIIRKHEMENKNESPFEQYLSDRYNRMIEHLENMQAGKFSMAIIGNGFKVLPIMMMLEQYDPEDMIESVKQVNAMYKSHSKIGHWM